MKTLFLTAAGILLLNVFCWAQSETVTTNKPDSERIIATDNKNLVNNQKGAMKKKDTIRDIETPIFRSKKGDGTPTKNPNKPQENFSSPLIHVKVKPN